MYRFWPLYYDWNYWMEFYQFAKEMAIKGRFWYAITWTWNTRTQVITEIISASLISFLPYKRSHINHNPGHKILCTSSNIRNTISDIYNGSRSSTTLRKERLSFGRNRENIVEVNICATAKLILKPDLATDCSISVLLLLVDSFKGKSAIPPPRMSFDEQLYEDFVAFDVFVINCPCSGK